MKTFNKNINTYLTHYNKNNKTKKAYKIDGNIVLTNAYSIIVLPLSANKKQINRIKELEIDIVEYDKIKDDYYNNDRLIAKQLKSFIKQFKEQHFCEKFIENEKNNITFDKKQIKNIQKIINGQEMFLSKENETTISLTGKNGYAWLLGMRSYWWINYLKYY